MERFTWLMRKQCFSANVFHVVLKEVPHLLRGQNEKIGVATGNAATIMAYNGLEKRGHCSGHGNCF